MVGYISKNYFLQVDVFSLRSNFLQANMFSYMRPI